MRGVPKPKDEDVIACAAHGELANSPIPHTVAWCRECGGWVDRSGRVLVKGIDARLPRRELIAP